MTNLEEEEAGREAEAVEGMVEGMEEEMEEGMEESEVMEEGMKTPICSMYSYQDYLG